MVVNFFLHRKFSIKHCTSVSLSRMFGPGVYPGTGGGFVRTRTTYKFLFSREEITVERIILRSFQHCASHQ